MMPKTLHTMARAYQDICAGEDPWTALGNFKNAWYDYARDHRAALVSDPLGKPDRDTEHTCHWAAFCAASVEFLCDRYGVACPAVFEPAYTLATPGMETPSSTWPTLSSSSIAGKRPQPLMRGGMSLAA